MTELLTSIYAAGPIDAVTKEESRDWQDALAELLPEMAIFSPAHPYRNITIDHAQFIDEVNRQGIRSASATLAYIPADRPAFGTIREIEYAVTLNKYVILVATHIKSFLTYDVTVVPTLEEAAKTIERHNRFYRTDIYG